MVLGFGAAFARAADAAGRSAPPACYIAGLGYAVPGTVLALGLLSPLVAVDEAINAVVRTLDRRARRPGAGRLERRGDQRLCDPLPRHRDRLRPGRPRPHLDRAGRRRAHRSARARPALIRSIHLPLLRPALWGAALLVFVDCLKELPATLLLRPLNVETLSTYIYQFATRGNFEEGSLAALLSCWSASSR